MLANNEGSGGAKGGKRRAGITGKKKKKSLRVIARKNIDKKKPFTVYNECLKRGKLNIPRGCEILSKVKTKRKKNYFTGSKQVVNVKETTFQLGI